MEIRRLKVSDATIIGAAILAGVGAGIFDNVAAGVEKMVHFTDTIAPIEKNIEKYNKLYKAYKKMYNALSENGVYTEFSALCE